MVAWFSIRRWGGKKGKILNQNPLTLATAIVQIVTYIYQLPRNKVLWESIAILEDHTQINVSRDESHTSNHFCTVDQSRVIQCFLSDYCPIIQSYYFAPWPRSYKTCIIFGYILPSMNTLFIAFCLQIHKTLLKNKQCMFFNFFHFLS